MSRSAVDLFTPDAPLPGFDRLKGVNLFEHQADGVAFLLSKKRAILGDDMGLGKTRQAITPWRSAAAHVRRQCCQYIFFARHLGFLFM